MVRILGLWSGSVVALSLQATAAVVSPDTRPVLPVPGLVQIRVRLFFTLTMFEVLMRP